MAKETSEHAKSTFSDRKGPVGTKGYTGNPGGRPKMPEEIRKAFQDLTPEAIKTLAEIMREGKFDSDRVKATEVILDRAWGKAIQQVDADFGGSLQIIIVDDIPKKNAK